MGYLREVAPASALDPLDSSLRSAFQHKGTAATTLAVSVVIAFYGATGVLESARRALNVVFDVEGGRSFLRRKTVDVLSTVVLMTLILVSLVLVFVGGRFAEDLLGFAGFGPEVADLWNLARWPAAVAVAVLVFSFLYYVTPDLRHRSFRWLTPGAIVGVALWLGASWGFATYVCARRRRRRALRRLRGRDRARRLDLALERRAAARRRAERRDRAGRRVTARAKTTAARRARPSRARSRAR